MDQRPDEQDLIFRFQGGHVGLALTATVGERWNRGFERLTSSQDLARWLVAAELLASPPKVAGEDLAAARELREAIYKTAKARIAGRALPPRALSVINAHARVPALSPQLSRRGGVSWASDAPVRAALSLIARETIGLLTGRFSGRIRECASPECALLFVDESRPGRRRWCSSETCGSRARSAAYRARKADERAPAAR